MAGRSALIAGATGLVGGHLLDRLLEHPSCSQVVALVRRELGRSHPKLEQRVVDFDALPSLELPHVDDVYCTLGTTIRTAGSQEAFRRVDFTYVHELARAGARCGAAQFLVVSSLGADASSSVFYSRTKGEMEQAVAAEPYRAVHIFRPSIIAGDRRESRVGERIALATMRALELLMVGPLRRYRAIHADTIAAAMIAAAHAGASGTVIHESERIAELAA